MFGWIFHDWSDKYASRILKNLRQALKKGARVVIGEVCLSEPGDVSELAERQLRYAYSF